MWLTSVVVGITPWTTHQQQAVYDLEGGLDAKKSPLPTAIGPSHSLSKALSHVRPRI
ncbi:hypothetical protein M378DRAFT_160525 [Amanita muscaria Koide BX008]|uniref:Uncharacterized protein n=1 Tax=Amanita muscaria (strain Koide BX008) TaxID=946122 RepID=A0A0C2WXM7_AMAMK|nr:hypothetical protein M378DRAFT_160525 [Amanita muscaria Koide BX008]